MDWILPMWLLDWMYNTKDLDKEHREPSYFYLNGLKVLRKCDYMTIGVTPWAIKTIYE